MLNRMMNWGSRGAAFGLGQAARGMGWYGNFLGNHPTAGLGLAAGAGALGLAGSSYLSSGSPYLSAMAGGALGARFLGGAVPRGLATRGASAMRGLGGAFGMASRSAGMKRIRGLGGGLIGAAGGLAFSGISNWLWG